MAEDIRAFLSNLERNGQLLRVKDEIDRLDDMGAFFARADYYHVDKAILFENPKGFDIPVLANTVGGHGYTRIAATGMKSIVPRAGITSASTGPA